MVSRQPALDHLAIRSIQATPPGLISTRPALLARSEVARDVLGRLRARLRRPQPSGKRPSSNPTSIWRKAAIGGRPPHRREERENSLAEDYARERSGRAFRLTSHGRYRHSENAAGHLRAAGAEIATAKIGGPAEFLPQRAQPRRRSGCRKTACNLSERYRKSPDLPKGSPRAPIVPYCDGTAQDP